MITIQLTQRAQKLYKKLPKEIKNKFDKQLTKLKNDLNYPSLHTKKMSGQEPYEARIDYRYRFTFMMENNTIYIFTVGPHDEGLGKK